LAAIAFGIVFIVVSALGIPFGIRSSHAVLLTILALVFIFPAFINVHIAIAAPDKESLKSRICAARRAFGMLLCAATVYSGASFRIAVPLFLLGIVLNFGTLLIE
jgi:hypothetical protein